ncbi:MAG: hypothetical protein RL354_904, partial [Planctomycetota bacterium]
FLYSVRSTFTNGEVRSDFISWLRSGHLADVVKAGALDAEIVEFEALEGTPGDVETRYHFASREAFDAYANGPAVALRAEGAARFPPSRGIVMTRGMAMSLLRIGR